jgi:hypothetical protein|tara:strand:- start:612 stop:863 length:252 start_codon:yes stop_codon:yes gene_type:complete
MSLNKTYNKLINIAQELNIKIIKGKGNFKGGICVYKKENIIVLNHNKPIQERLKNLVLSLLQFDIDKVKMDQQTKRLFQNYSN